MIKFVLNKIIFLMLTIFVLFGIKNIAYGHAKITYVFPKHKSTIVTTDEVSINFNRKLRLTKVVVVKDKQQIIKFDMTEKFGKKFTYEVKQKLNAGKYTVKWWGIALDGHTMRGAWRFIVE